MYEAAKIARDSGSKLVSFKSNDAEMLEQLLKENQVIKKKLIAVDGVVEATLIDDENEEGLVAYLKVEKRILDEEKLLSLASSN